VKGDLTDPRSLEQFAAGLEAVIHCAARTSEGAPDARQSQAVNVDGTSALLAACRAAGCRRFIHISSQSARPENPTAYGHTKWLSEELVRSSGFSYTILRPSTVYGPGTRGLFWKMVHLTKSVRIIPVIGRGLEQFRPVHVDDIAFAIEACLQGPASLQHTYDLGGADVVTFGGFVQAIADCLGVSVRQIHLPVWACRLAAQLLSWMPSPPMTIDNIVGMEQLQSCDNGPAERDFGYKPRGLAEGLGQTLKG
jgi:nucleoside-diphosphate-sugar epimerase